MHITLRRWPPPRCPRADKGGKKDLNRRTSSGNWIDDRVTWKEELNYKKAMVGAGWAGEGRQGCARRVVRNPGPLCLQRCAWGSVPVQLQAELSAIL